MIIIKTIGIVRILLNSSLCLLLFVVCLSNSYAVEQVLPKTLLQVKQSIVAVGTFMPKRSPRSIFLGTGFAVETDLIVTNAHVIPENIDIEHLEQVAIFYQKDNEDKVIFAKVVGMDKEHDLALLKISESILPP